MHRVNSKQRASLTRQQLYDMIWAEPMRLLAPRFGISDVGLAKICRRAAIPLPPPGFWTMIRHKKRVKRSSLPDKPADCIEPLQISASGHRKADLDQNLPTDIRDAITAERDGRAKVHVLTKNSHPLVDRWLQEDARTPSVGHYRPQRPRFSNVEKRRLRFLSVLFQELELRKGAIEPDSRWKFRVTLVGEKLSISVDEALKQVRVPDQHGYYGRDYRIENQGTGELRLQIEHFLDIPLQRRWRDRPERPLEQQLRDILIGLFFAASEIRRERLEAEASARAEARAEALREDERKKREAERAKIEVLKCQASDWAHAQAIRRFVSAAVKSPRPRGNRSTLRTWAKWAREIADRIDPLSTESVASG